MIDLGLVCRPAALAKGDGGNLHYLDREKPQRPLEQSGQITYAPAK
jgi:hypothetical protein